jgi:1,4-dihydroxy-6-naphthoate synthase
MNIAFSPCPNDTFVFHAWVHGLVADAPFLEVSYADINITNEWALHDNGPDILKISFGALPYIHEQYALLPCGGALGRGCGPLVLVADGLHRHDSVTNAKDLKKKRVAVPSKSSTAYLLFRLWADKHVPGGIGEVVVLPFHEIMPAVRDGLVDSGLVIHEARFTYSGYGLAQLVDLGCWWEEETGYPIPLGAIIAKRSLPLDSIAAWIQTSVAYAWKHPEASLAYVMQHAQEMSDEVAREHIELYVNQFTSDLGQEGYAAIEALLTRSAEAGITPPIDLKYIWGGVKHD